MIDNLLQTVYIFNPDGMDPFLNLRRGSPQGQYSQRIGLSSTEMSVSGPKTAIPEFLPQSSKNGKSSPKNFCSVSGRTSDKQTDSQLVGRKQLDREASAPANRMTKR